MCVLRWVCVLKMGVRAKDGEVRAKMEVRTLRWMCVLKMNLRTKDGCAMLRWVCV
jgi:hypothetical protein